MQEKKENSGSVREKAQAERNVMPKIVAGKLERGKVCRTLSWIWSTDSVMSAF